MKIITKRAAEWFGLFVLLSGIGAGWLTYSWYELSGGFENPLVNSYELCYYAFNSALLTILGILLLAKRYKLFSFFAIVLGISVSASLFVGGIVIHSLFLSTTFLGMSAVAVGGPALVPMFHVAVYVSLFRGIQHVRGKIGYAGSKMADSPAIPPSADASGPESNN